MSSVALLLAALTLVHLLKAGQGANPISIPIIQNALNVHTARFAKLPDSLGAAAKIICMVPHGRDLYVCTLNRIYKVTPNGAQSLWFDVAAAIRSATGRNLNFENKAHGGVRSIAFHPKFKKNRLIYLSFMEDRPGNPGSFKYISSPSNPIAADSVVAEWKVSRSTKKPIPSTYRMLFRVGMPKFDHPIKQIAFYKKNLYIAHGDGSEQSATVGGGQGNDALGKILRINPKKKGSKPYSIPKSNPFRGSSPMPDEVWAWGFRNPHNICFGKDGTLYAADAGRANVEEVNIVLRGKNYGWSKREGTFVHTGGRLIFGGRPLPPNDAMYGFEYPAAQYGHEGSPGDGFIGQAIAGGCPVENGSPMSGKYYYSDFPITGVLYFSEIKDLKNAKTRGPPRALRQARTKKAKIFFDHDNNPRTPPRMYNSLGDVMRAEPAYRDEGRVDLRFGRGSRGELYWSSKRSGRVYIFTSSLKGGPGGKP